jgi:hypothetical protein
MLERDTSSEYTAKIKLSGVKSMYCVITIEGREQSLKIIERANLERKSLFSIKIQN